MKNFWIKTFRQLAVASAVAASSMFYSAMCYANAFDSAADPVYADGWQAGDNGGTGFTAWNFDTDTFVTTPGIQAIDDGLQSGGANSSPFNNIGKAWRIALPDANGLPRAGRGFAPLQVGQTLSVTIDNPTVRQFFKGYFIRLTGGTGGVNGNICYGGAACSSGATPTEKMSFSTFEYFTNGLWSLNDSAGGTPTTLFDTDTAAAGAVFSVMRTGVETYQATMKPLGAAPAYVQSGTFKTGSPVDWIEFTFFNTPTSTTSATDFYVSSMQIVPEPASCTLLVLGAAGVFACGASRKRRD